MDDIRAIEDYGYYHALTGQSREEWEEWRAETIELWGLDNSNCDIAPEGR